VKKSLATICCQCRFKNSFQCCLAASFRRGLDAIPFQDIRNRVVSEQMTQIGQGSLYPSITPSTILFCHPDHNTRDFITRATAPRRSKRASIVFLSNQSSVPGQQCFGRNDRRNL